MVASSEHRINSFHPIIYVRGYAMTQTEIEDTVATPYMGFNLGSTKVRQNWQGGIERHIFESPLVRLMKDYGYRDCFADGCEQQGRLPARSIVIHRYYEPASRDMGEGTVPSIEQAAAELKALIYRVREQVCGEDADVRAAFRVHLVAHSMGGLVCRCFLQNDKVSSAADRALVDKVFTYATPHNGIDMAGLNVPRFLGLFDMNNFNREIMRGYLGLGAKEPVNQLGGKFDPRRVFCLVGTNAKDYSVGGGLSARLACELSDGLVRIENATVKGSPRAFVYRSHSGHHGIVNSEAGYQNLVRFLFGNVQAQGLLETDVLPQPPTVRRAQQAGKQVRASYYFEATISPRGGAAYRLSERRKESFSAVLRRFDELQPTSGTAPRWPVLFSVFLDTRKITQGRTLVFSVQLSVSTTGYEIDGILWHEREIPGESLYENTLIIRVSQGKDGCRLRYVCAEESWGEGQGRVVPRDDAGWYIPLSTRKGFKGRLRLVVRAWE